MGEHRRARRPGRSSPRCSRSATTRRACSRSWPTRSTRSSPTAASAGSGSAVSCNAVVRMRGLAPGNYFHEWMSEQLAASPLAKELGKTELTFADVKRRDLPPRSEVPDITDEQYERARYRLHVIGVRGDERADAAAAGRAAELPGQAGQAARQGHLPDRRRRADEHELSVPVPRRSSSTRTASRTTSSTAGCSRTSRSGSSTARTRSARRGASGCIRARAATEGLPHRAIPRPLWSVPLLKAMFSAATEAWDRQQPGAHRLGADGQHPDARDQHDRLQPDAGERRQSLYGWGKDAASAFFNDPAQQSYLNSFGQTVAAPAPRAESPPVPLSTT